MDIELRAITEEDTLFLLRLYGTTREDELALTNFSEEEKGAFYRQQFDAQQRAYTTRCPKARFDLIVSREVPVGRLYVDRRETDIRILDLVLLPRWRGHGIGTFLLNKLQNEGRESGLPVSLHVARSNPRAISWYEQNGFASVSGDENHIFMVWPEAASPPPP